LQEQNLDRLVKDCITPVEFFVRGDQTIKTNLQDLQGKHVEQKIIYFYVVDNEHKLLGIVPTRKMLLSPPQTLIKDIMDHSVIKAHQKQTLLDVIEIMEKNRLLAVPVVDDNGKLCGMIDVQTYMEGTFNIADTRHRLDVFQFIGLTLEEGKKFSIFEGYKLRMPWIFCNMVGGLLCAIISRYNEDVLSRVLILAFFIPLVLTLSESISMQSMTQSLQYVKQSKTTFKYLYLKAIKEWKTVSIISLTAGTVIGSLSLLWGDGLMPSFVIGFGIFSSVMISSFFGTLIPIILHSRQLDPKVASGPVVLTLADVLTTLIYLSLASWWLL
jgi:magnesium transporter